MVIEIFQEGLKTQSEGIGISDVYQHTMRKNIATDETLDVLSLQRGFNSNAGINTHIIGKQNCQFILVT